VQHRSQGKGKKKSRRRKGEINVKITFLKKKKWWKERKKES
jgi:hypothetical protein